MVRKKRAPASTELSRAKRALADMRARFLQLYDLAPAAILTLDAKGTVLEANLAAGSLLGATKRDLLKRPLSAFIHPDDQGRFTELGKKLPGGRSGRSLDLRFARGGAFFWARVDLTLGYDEDGALLYRLVLTDVDERVRAQADLLRLRAAVDHAHDGIAIAGLDGTLQFVNLAWAKMHGCVPEELVGQPMRISHTPEQMKTDVIPFNEKVRAHGSWAGEVGHMRKDGTTFMTWMSTVLLRDAGGQPSGLIGMADDITERRTAADYLARVLTEREAILKSIPDLFYRLDGDLRLQDWNQVFELASGYSPEQLKGMKALDFFRSDKQIISEGIEEAMRKGQAFRTGRLLTRRGEEIPVFWSAAALRGPEGTFLGLVGIGRDLTVK